MITEADRAVEALAYVATKSAAMWVAVAFVFVAVRALRRGGRAL